MNGITIGMSDFARKRHSPQSGHSYTPDLSELDLITMVHEAWDTRIPGHGETTLNRKVLVILNSEKSKHFRIPFVSLHPELPVQARVTRRQDGEDYYIETYISGYDAEKLGLQPKIAKSVKIVCYSAEALLENNGTRSTDCDWEIVAVLASENEDNEEPMHPLTMARNFLEMPGGTKGEYTAEEFAKAIMYWSGSKGVRIISER